MAEKDPDTRSASVIQRLFRIKTESFARRLDSHRKIFELPIDLAFGALSFPYKDAAREADALRQALFPLEALARELSLAVSRRRSM